MTFIAKLIESGTAEEIFLDIENDPPDANYAMKYGAAIFYIKQLVAERDKKMNTAYEDGWKDCEKKLNQAKKEMQK